MEILQPPYSIEIITVDDTRIVYSSDGTTFLLDGVPTPEITDFLTLTYLEQVVDNNTEIKSYKLFDRILTP